MKAIKLYFHLSLFCFIGGNLLYSCKPSSVSKNSPRDLAGYELSNEANGVTIAKMMVADSILSEKGFISNSQKNGAWISYNKANGRIKEIKSYTNGKLNGPQITFNERGQMLTQANYVNDQLDGLKGEYKFGRPLKTSMYKQGKLDGLHIAYFDNGKIQKEVEYKDGQMDGKMRTYTDEGKISLEYIYRAGEKVSGGIIE